MANVAPTITGHALVAALLQAAQTSARVQQAAVEAARRLQQGTTPPAPPAPTTEATPRPR